MLKLTNTIGFSAITFARNTCFLTILIFIDLSWIKEIASICYNLVLSTTLVVRHTVVSKLSIISTQVFLLVPLNKKCTYIMQVSSY